MRAPPPGSAPRLAPQGPPFGPVTGHRVGKRMRVGREPSCTLQRLREALDKFCRSLPPPPPLGHKCAFMERQRHTAARKKRLVPISQRGKLAQQPQDPHGSERGSEGVGIQTPFHQNGSNKNDSR